MPSILAARNVPTSRVCAMGLPGATTNEPSLRGVTSGSAKSRLRTSAAFTLFVRDALGREQRFLETGGTERRWRRLRERALMRLHLVAWKGRFLGFLPLLFFLL